jgi:hypothetical protein
MMDKMPTFSDVLEAADMLPLDDQEALAGVLQRRVIERRRQELAREAREAEQEYRTGGCRSVSPDELISEILQ